jgi:hypothetical protein
MWSHIQKLCVCVRACAQPVCVCVCLCVRVCVCVHVRTRVEERDPVTFVVEVGTLDTEMWNVEYKKELHLIFFYDNQ